MTTAPDQDTLRSPHSSAPVGPAGYAQIIVHHLDEGNQWQRFDSAYFLWLSRRTAEACCLLLLSLHAGETVSNDGSGKENADLSTLIGRVSGIKVLNSNSRVLLELLRTVGNVGAHVRGPNEDRTPLVRTVAASWASLLRELRNGPLADKVEWPPDMEDRLSLMVSGGHSMSLEEKAAKLTALEREVGDLRARAKELESQVLGERDLVATLRSQLATQQVKQRRINWIPRLVLSGLGLLAFTAAVSCTGFGGAFGLGLMELGDRLYRSLAPSRDSASAVASGAERPGAPADPTVPVSPLATQSALVGDSPSPSAGTDCPAGMVRITATTLRLGQPIGGRQDWPRPSTSKLPRLTVPSFCIDSRPVSAADAAAWGGVDCAAPAEGVFAATCIGRDAAENWCAKHHPGGRLPTLAEWEVIARLPESTLEDIDSLYREWVSDRFPPAVLSREDPNWTKGDGMFRQPLPPQRPPLDPVGNVLWGWNQQDPDNRYGNLGFRCAVNPK